MSKITNHSSETIRLNASLKSPFSIVYLPFIARLYRTAFRPRKRVSKKLIGKPAKSLFRGLSFLGFSGTGIAQLQTPKGPKKKFLEVILSLVHYICYKAFLYTNVKHLNY